MELGFPVAEQTSQQVEGKPLQLQWFERNRLELHPENARPYDVLLGRLGADSLAAQKRDSVGLKSTQLQLIKRDILNLRLNRKFDWICRARNTGTYDNSELGRSEKQIPETAFQRAIATLARSCE